MMILGRGSFELLLYALMILLHIQTSIGFNSTTANDETRCIKSEREALVAFKRGLVVTYGRLSSWGNEEEKRNCCKWEGVQCDNTTGHIIVLDLGEFQLTGNLSSSLFEFQHLTYLDLSWNNFNLSHISKSIGLLNKLQHLYLHQCNLSGSLPNQLANLTSLQYLSLGDNNFNSVKNLEWLSYLSYLQSLDMSGIDLSRVTNYLLQVIHKLPSLTSLDIGSTNLTTSPFQSLLKFNNSLVFLQLTSNSFQGLIQENLGHMTSLETLILIDNQFEGGIPKSFGNLCKLSL
ncbi:hypothetical protein SLE2022_357830 [Rubroshorea leprosula]